VRSLVAEDGVLLDPTSFNYVDRLSRLDPETLEVTATIPLGGVLGSADDDALAYGAGAVWVWSAPQHQLLRIDVATNKVDGTVKPAGTVGGTIAFGDGAVWLRR